MDRSRNECALDPVCTTRTGQEIGCVAWRNTDKGTLVWPHHCLACHSQTDILPGRQRILVSKRARLGTRSNRSLGMASPND
jgi:hypothetical protein